MRVFARGLGSRFLLAVLAASAISAAPPPEPLAEYFPLVPGSETVMDAEVVEGGQTTHTLARRIIGKKPVIRAGKTYYRTLSTLEGYQQYTTLVRRDGNGFYTIDEADRFALEQRDIPIPLEIGQEWKRFVRGGIRRDRAVARETVTIGERVYADCFHIHTEADDGEASEDYWEAPKIGTVKSVSQYSNGIQITLLLREYSAAPKNLPAEPPAPGSEKPAVGAP